ncbi:MAG TPA: type 1 glutamine amidotransferase [Acidiferrobacter sp.]|nr:type 1 glutamine amidotransferase [Acidiferrobacter sp.]
MKPIAIFRHAPGEGPGYLAEVLTRNAIPFTTICVDKGEALPPSCAPYAGLVFMGGPMSVNDALPWIPQTLALIREAQAANMPLLGHCLGGQLISKALGGQITKNAVQEVGWGVVERLQNEVAQQWFGRLPSSFEVFHWHGETFSIPSGAAHILAGRFCAHQGFAIGRTLALQCHIEMTPGMIDKWAKSPDGQQLVASPSIQTAAAFHERLGERLQALHQVADIVYGQWLEQLCA